MPTSEDVCTTWIATSQVAGRVRVDVGGTASQRGDRVAPFAPRVIATGAWDAQVVLVPTTALLLDGDHVAVHLKVGAGTRLRILEVSGMVAYSGPGRGASYRTHIEVSPGAAVVWEALPFVLAAGSRVHREVRVMLGTAARACLRETLVLGRTGERAGRLLASTRITDPGGPLLTEDLDIGAGHRLPGILGRQRVLDQVTLAGIRPPNTDPATLHLARPGAVHRRLAKEAHAAAVDDVAGRWAALSVPSLSDQTTTEEDATCTSLTTS